MKSKKGEIELSIGSIVIIVLAMAMLILGMVLVKNIFVVDYEEDINHTFILNGEEMDALMVCDNYWHYEEIKGFIPCVINKTVGGIGGESINWSLSPQENCENSGGEFIGLNLYNDTRAKELYDTLLPRCFEFKDTDISNTWLNVSGCVCHGEELNSSFIPNCDQYDCGDALLVVRKW